MNVALLIPTYNGGGLWKESLEGIRMQNITLSKKIIIDSGSRDATVEDARRDGFQVLTIAAKDFRHGRARQKLIDVCEDIDICIFITQDAILATPDSLNNLVKAFDDPSVGMVYGRQLPHKNAKTLEAHARHFNYPESSSIKSKNDISKYGFRTIFCSNSFAAYRKTALLEVGGFDKESIMGEDTLVAAKMISENWKVGYVAEATIFHSHSYTLMEELRRYFDTGVFHAQNVWLYDLFGKPTGEGFKYVRSEFKYTWSKSSSGIIHIIPKTICKFVGFTLGKRYRSLPKKVVRFLSMHKAFWH